MANAQGSPIWYELMTSDADAAKRFYDDVVGWTIEAQASNPMDYRMIAAADGNVGGVMKIGADMAAGGARPMWLFYIGVDDVDATTEKAKALGGSVHVPPTDIPGVGRFAFLADPQGAPFYVMRGASDAESTAFAPETAGHCAWNELVTTDQDRALDFYGKLFGWTKAGAMPMGEMGDYTFIGGTVDRFGAMMNAPGPAHWNFYFRVDDIDAAAARVKAVGGTVDRGPHEVPGGDHIIQGTDPQGAMFALVGSKRGG